MTGVRIPAPDTGYLVVLGDLDGVWSGSIDRLL